MRSWIFFSLAAVACGGAVTSVDGNKTTNSLAPADSQQLCTDTYDYVRNNFSADDMAKLSCGFDFAASQDPTTCQQSYDSCVSKAEASIGQFTFPATPDCTSFDAQILQCNTTVAEYTKCLQQAVNIMKTAESSFPVCTQAQSQNIALQMAQGVTSDCVQLFDTCKIAFVPGATATALPDGGAPDGG